MVIRRRDFSKHLVHLTRNLQESSARDNLLSILSNRTIEARSPFGVAVARLKIAGCDTESALASQRVCCFSETPLEDLGGLIDPGMWRRFKFQPYGVVFERDFMVAKGANPVWYLNSYSAPGVTFEWLVRDVNTLIDAVIMSESATPDAKAAAFQKSPMCRLAPMIETMGKWRRPSGGTRKKDFSFEREWRHAGDFHFTPNDVKAILTPPEDRDDFLAELEEDAPELYAAEQWRGLEASDVLDE